MTHIASVRDVERLTGFEFFVDRQRWPQEEAIRLRIHINNQTLRYFEE